MLPATEAIPKEMLPIVDKPIIQYIVEEVVVSDVKKSINTTAKLEGFIEKIKIIFLARKNF